MVPNARDAADPQSVTLAAMHSRNAAFGDESCYHCHRDYGMFGAVTTKLAGMKHMWRHYTRDPADPIALYKPYPNSNCTVCHSTTLPGWKDEPEHQAVMDDIAAGKVGCASKGCHGPPHPEPKGKP
jgi:cytochrome c-type protein NapC